MDAWVGGSSGPDGSELSYTTQQAWPLWMGAEGRGGIEQLLEAALFAAGLNWVELNRFWLHFITTCCTQNETWRELFHPRVVVVSQSPTAKHCFPDYATECCHLRGIFSYQNKQRIVRVNERIQHFVSEGLNIHSPAARVVLVENNFMNQSLAWGCSCYLFVLDLYFLNVLNTKDFVCILCYLTPSYVISNL